MNLAACALLFLVTLNTQQGRMASAYPSNMIYALYQLPVAESEAWIDGEDSEPWPLTLYPIHVASTKRMAVAGKRGTGLGGDGNIAVRTRRGKVLRISKGKQKRSQPSLEQDPYFFSNTAAGQAQDFTLEPFVIRYV